jgi:Tol biopolymer transport system component
MKRNLSLVLFCLFIAALVAACGSSDGDGGKERIAFVSARDGNSEICVMAVPDGTDGSGVTRLTNNSADDGLPTWSPDGAPGGDRIVFVSERDSVDIYVVDADGGNEARLTDSPAQDHSPVWSP